MKPEIGLQLFSVKDALGKDYLATIEKVAEIGYKNVELICRVNEHGLTFGQDIKPSDHRRYLDNLGLQVIGCHIMPKDDMDWNAVIESCIETGAPALVIPFALFASKAEVLNFCQKMNMVAGLCSKKGLRLYYHNHFQEFQQFEGQPVMQMLVENSDPDLVMFEFDTYWAVRGGQDPLEWIEKLGKRCDLIHQKDMPHGLNPVNLFKLWDENPQAGIMDLFGTIGADQFTEIGSGSIDIPGIIKSACSQGQVRYIIVEQDKTSRDELESIALSFKNLSEILARL